MSAACDIDQLDAPSVIKT